MSIIQDITQAQTPTAATDAATSAGLDIMGKQDFLTLLVAQLQNQDPLNPDDPTEFTAQLAQFSQLEQLFNLNDSMKNLVTSNANSDKFATLQTIGKNVVFQGKLVFDFIVPPEVAKIILIVSIGDEFPAQAVLELSSKFPGPYIVFISIKVVFILVILLTDGKFTTDTV